MPGIMGMPAGAPVAVGGIWPPNAPKGAGHGGTIMLFPGLPLGLVTGLVMGLKA